MPPPRIFRGRRGAISELYSSMLMVGVTLATGGLVVSAALGQFGLANSSASTGVAVEQYSAGVGVSLVFLVASPAATCPTYGGFREGTSVTVGLYNYGIGSFTPGSVAFNGSVYSGAYPAVPPGSLGNFSVSLGSCAHSSGQTVLVVDSMGDEVQLAS